MPSDKPKLSIKHIDSDWQRLREEFLQKLAADKEKRKQKKTEPQIGFFVKYFGCCLPAKISSREHLLAEANYPKKTIWIHR